MEQPPPPSTNTAAHFEKMKITHLYRRICYNGAPKLLNSCATPFPNRAVLNSVQVCRENAVNADWSILVYATKLQRATCTVVYCN